MAKNTNIKIVLDHDAIIDRYAEGIAKDTDDAFSQLSNSVKRAVAFYRLILATLFVPSGMAKADYDKMRGGTFYGLLSKPDHVLFYSGKRAYPSSAYCTYAFGLNYLHSAPRLAEYKLTNTVATMIDYHQWLQVMFADAIDKDGTWCGLARKKDETIAKNWITVKATDTDKAEGKSYHSAVRKSAVSDPSTPIPSAIREIAQAVAEMSPQKLRIVSVDYDMVNWTQEAIVDMITGSIAQWTINNNKALAAKAVAKKAKAKAKASK
jgi:hypothetical protein